MRQEPHWFSYCRTQWWALDRRRCLSSSRQHRKNERRHSTRRSRPRRLAEELQATIAAGERPILTCSALKQRYRQTLRDAVPALCFVFLELSPEEATRRVRARPGHFMPASLIDSQFAALEAPHDEPLTLVLDATLPVDQLATRVDQWLKPCGESVLAQTA